MVATSVRARAMRWSGAPSDGPGVLNRFSPPIVSEVVVGGHERRVVDARLDAIELRFDEHCFADVDAGYVPT